MAANLEAVLRVVDHASGPLDAIDKKVGGLSHTLGTGLKVAGATAALGIGTAIVAGISFVKQAAEEEAGVLRLAAAIDANGGSWEAQGAQIEKAIQARQKLAFSDDELRSSLSMLVAQTGNVDEAMRRQAVAMDLARGADIDLGSASKLLGKVTDESHAALSRLGIVVDKNADSTEVLAAVQQRFGGQAAAFAEGAEGKWARVGIQFDNIKETIGGALLPLVTSLGGKLGTFLEENQDDIERLVASFERWATEALPKIQAFVESQVIPILVDAFKQLRQMVEGAAPHVKNIADFLSENKEVALALLLVLVVLAIVFGGPIVTILALITVGALLLAHWDAVRAKADEIILKVKEFPILGEIVEAVFGFIANRVQFWMTVAKAVIDIVLGVLTADWDRAWQGLKALALAPLELLKADLGVVLNALKGIAGDTLAGLGDLIAAPFNAGVGQVRTAVNEIIGIFNTLIDGVNSIPDIHISNPLGPDINIAIPDIPRLPTIGGGGSGAVTVPFVPEGGIGLYQAGGLVRHAMQVLGERGPELAALPIGTRVFNADQTRGMLQGGGGGDIHIHIGNIELGRGVDRTDVADLMDMIEHAWSVRRWRGI